MLNGPINTLRGNMYVGADIYNVSTEVLCHRNTTVYTLVVFCP